MSEDFTADTKVVVGSSAPAVLTVIVVEDRELTSALTPEVKQPVVDLPVELRIPLPGPPRALGDWLPEVIFVVNQLALGAAGNGVWVAIESLCQRLDKHRRRRRARKDLALAESPSTRITIVYPSRDGEVRIESVIVGPHDAVKAVKELRRIVTALEEIPENPES